MENSAGAGGTIGRSLDELATLFEALDARAARYLPRLLPPLGLRVDVTDRRRSTAYSTEIDKRIGLDRLRALHVNDAEAPLGSNSDRHANVLEGELGEGLGVFLGHPKLQGLPGGDGDARARTATGRTPAR